MTEITKEAFNSIVEKSEPTKGETKELYWREEFLAKGMFLVAIHNFVSCVTQYYVRDINA